MYVYLFHFQAIVKEMATELDLENAQARSCQLTRCDISTCYRRPHQRAVFDFIPVLCATGIVLQVVVQLFFFYLDFRSASVCALKLFLLE